MRIRRARPADDDVVTRLVADLKSLVALLDDNGATHWSRWARQSLAEVEQHDARGLSRLRQGYGGMGSFNDLVLDGDGFEDQRRLNDELDALRGRIYSSVTALLRELRRGEP